MKHLLSLVFGLLAYSAMAQSANCQISLHQESFAATDTIRFEVKINTDSELEVSVYGSEKMLHHTTDQLRAGEHTYRVVPGDAQPGKYFIQITGEGIREERTFRLR
jgi:hypothetical protein